jgi:ergothioneine biosynthesis protein EgtB
MPETSPIKWHLAHTSWFFEQFLLLQYWPTYKPFRAGYAFLFNSYYDSVGARVERAHRNLLSRPPLSEVHEYRNHVTHAVLDFFSELSEESSLIQSVLPVLVLGMHHEQQHQELILTDIKFNFFCNPLLPAYHTPGAQSDSAVRVDAEFPGDDPWLSLPGGIFSVGTRLDSDRDSADDSFSFDNETPQHRFFLEPFLIQSRKVTNREYIEFIEDGGYENASLWLSDGWDKRKKERWCAPLYWRKEGSSYSAFTLSGVRPLGLDEPVIHISHYEADAYARWRGARLPTEFEWEVAARQTPIQGVFLESERFHPGSPSSFWGGAWEWTSSAYLPFPGYRPPSGAFGEYNGKFMSNQMVLRGGSCATPQSHIRATYRNFFQPESRWQFTGLRLAKSRS